MRDGSGIGLKDGVLVNGGNEKKALVALKELYKDLKKWHDRFRAYATDRPVKRNRNTKGCLYNTKIVILY